MLRVFVGAEDFGEAEVGHLGDALAGDEDIARLDVAMDDAAGVGVLEGGADLGDEFERAGQIELAAMAQMVDVHAVDEFHDQIGIALGGAAVIVDVNDVRVVERGHGLGFAFKADTGVRVGAGLARQDFDRHAAGEAGVKTLIHRAHAAAAEQAFDFVAGIEGAGDPLRFPPPPHRCRVGWERRPRAATAGCWLRS